MDYSAKQEKKDLLKDNPIARDASGGRPWIVKHYKSSMGSAIKMESPMEKELVGKQKNLPEALKAKIRGFRSPSKEMKK
jgi:hypothetical protein